LQVVVPLIMAGVPVIQTIKIAVEAATLVAECIGAALW
jgi:hypothetical protein